MRKCETNYVSIKNKIKIIPNKTMAMLLFDKNFLPLSTIHK